MVAAGPAIASTIVPLANNSLHLVGKPGSSYLLKTTAAHTYETKSHASATFAPKIDRTVTRVSWGDDAVAVSRRVRAFEPSPAAWTTLEGVNVKLFRAKPIEGDGLPGEVLAVSPRLRVATGRGAVEISEVQPAGKSRMEAEAWGRGRGVRTGQVLE